MAIKNKKYNIPNFKLVKDNLFLHIDKRIKAGNNGSSVIVPHVCNNIDLFGAGFAGAINQNYPIVKENYHLLGKSFLRSNPGYVQYVKVLEDKNYGHSLIFANMIAQNGTICESNPRPLNYVHLVYSMLDIRKFISSKFQDQKVEIHAPKFGCGLAGGNWYFIQELINDIWINQDITIYQI